MSHVDPQNLKERVKELVNQGKVTRVAATCFLFSKGMVILPDGFRNLSDAEYNDGIAEVKEALEEQESQRAQLE